MSTFGEPGSHLVPRLDRTKLIQFGIAIESLLRRAQADFDSPDPLI